MSRWSVGHLEGERIDVEVLSPPANDCGYDWVRACAHVSIGAFRADIPMMLLASDMCRFREALTAMYRDLKGVAEFKTIEDQLWLRLEPDTRGHIRVNGQVKDDASFGNRLTFEWSGFDQTFLPRTISELAQVSEELGKIVG